MILNCQRQVVLANNKLLTTLNLTSEEVLGCRPGEIFQCVHATEHIWGCGTTRFCSQCGAGRAMVESIALIEPQVEDCRITCSSKSGMRALDLRVWATPLACHGHFTLFAIRDTTDEKRRAVLERLFFHDVLNAAGGLKGIMELWPDLSREETNEMSRVARNLAGQLVEEIRSHRDLVAAERGDLTVTLKHFDVAPLLSHLCILYSNHTVARCKRVSHPEIVGQTIIYSDELLLSRALGNLLKNALEASSAGSTVRLLFNGFEEPTISVSNDGFMPEEVQLQIFQRSFSTKSASGRGLGTYSVKLLTEKYLDGQVRFESSKSAGTTFTITLPPSRSES